MAVVRPELTVTECTRIIEELERDRVPQDLKNAVRELRRNRDKGRFIERHERERTRRLRAVLDENRGEPPDGAA
jgi:hypothetical protein